MRCFINDKEVDEDFFWEDMEIRTREYLEEKYPGDKRLDYMVESYMMDNHHDIESGRKVYVKEIKYEEKF